jgi:hypothetical protein
MVTKQTIKNSVLVQNLLTMSAREPHSQSTSKERPNPQAVKWHVLKLNAEHWPAAWLCSNCRMHSVKRKETKECQCIECSQPVQRQMSSYFPTKVNFYINLLLQCGRRNLQKKKNISTLHLYLSVLYFIRELLPFGNDSFILVKYRTTKLGNEFSFKKILLESFRNNNTINIDILFVLIHY